MLLNVDNKQLGACFFKSCIPKMIFDKDGKRTSTQETTGEGMPIWLVRAERQGEDGKEEIFTVAVPVKRNPAEGLQLNEQIAFVGLKIETGLKKDNRRWACFQAENIVRKKRSE